MYLDEQYKLYHAAHSLVTDNHFDVLHIDENSNEIWLEKYENKTSQVVRFVQKGFDWKNHLKRDIAQVFQKSKSMKKLILGKRIELYNVYVSSHAPVDDWEILKKPMQLKEKNPLKMKIYYLDEADSHNELRRLEQDLNLSLNPNPLYSEDVKETKVRNYKASLLQEMQNKRQEVQNVFSFGKPYFTYLLIAINVLLFIMLEMNGGSSSIETLIDMGAKYNPDIMNGEWWRIISSMFLHIGFLHLFMNMLAIYYLGTAVERIYGRGRFLVIYFLAGIGGGLASFAFTTSVSAGASGAVFGLFGALLFFGLVYKRIFLQSMGKSILIILVINIALGFLVPQIDMGAHMGGLLAGFIGSAIVHLPNKGSTRVQVPAFLLYALLIGSLAVFGINNNLSSQTYQLMQIEQLLMEDSYEEVVSLAGEALELNGDMEGALLFQRAYAYIELNEIDLAIMDLERSIESEPVLPEAYYNLALLYYNRGEVEEAAEMITSAYHMKPDDEAFITLYEEITGETQ
ncbi:rhomboid family intramembrane serine protease [Oceanobacillus saliphilus]|uniref:rhomboid family intramembrane serine protease n=1 Tax=Oceanobacillus saliphilus TaxID=2925834 RepID=UPI00201DCA34|nr:rhomboid family intramembrane serine protease [Oceanobacillus saliphilus]